VCVCVWHACVCEDGCSSEQLPCMLDALGAGESAGMAPGVCVCLCVCFVFGVRVCVKMGAAVSGCRVC